MSIFALVYYWHKFTLHKYTLIILKRTYFYHSIIKSYLLVFLMLVPYICKIIGKTKFFMVIRIFFTKDKCKPCLGIGTKIFAKIIALSSQE